MTGKSKNNNSANSHQTKQEVEIEKLRDENKWLRLKEYASNLSTKDAKIQLLAKFCIAESEFENSLFSNPLTFSSTQQGELVRNPKILDPHESKILYDAEVLFKDIVSRADKNSITIEASILLTKLFYSQYRYEEAIKQVNSPLVKEVVGEHLKDLSAYLQSKQLLHQQQSLQQLTKTKSLRQLQLYAELHSMRGLCLEMKRKNEDKRDDQDTIDSYELSSIFAIQHSLLLHQKIVNNTPNADLSPTNNLNNFDDNLDLINPLYENAIQKAPLLYIKRGEQHMGVKKFRELLLKKNIQSITSIRQILLKKFAECLLFHVPYSKYSPLVLSTDDDKRKFLYKPTNQDEEILLCLSLSQYMASKEVMLLRQTQFKQIREYTYNNAVNSLDLLLVYLAYHRSYNVLIDKFEMAMKYSFEEFNIWYQYGLTLMCDQKYYKAYAVLKECSRMRPDHVTCHLLLAQIALENLILIDESLEWCVKVHELTEYKNKKAHILYGCGLCIKAKLQRQHAMHLSYYEQALDSFKKANVIDPNDYLPLYHMGHCYSILRQINEAIEYVQKSLKYKPDDKDSLHLFALLLTSVKNYDDAHTIMCKACALYDDFELLYTKIRIEELLYGFNHSVNSILNLIITYKQKLQQPNDISNSRASSAVSLSQPGIMSYAKNLASANQSLDSYQNFETASLLNLQHSFKINESIGKTITMLIQSDRLEAKFGNAQQIQNVQQTILLTRILTLIGEFYLRNDKLIDAEMCCQEIASLNPMSYLYIYLKGRIYEYKQDYQQAKLHYQNALSINPYHIQSLQQMSLILCQLENFHLAEKMIRDAISLNSSLPDSWQILARVLDYQNDNQSALKCYQTCLQLESTNPVVPFTSLNRIL